MAIYKVYAEVISDVYAYIEAPSEEDAYDYARNVLDGNDFTEDVCGGDFIVSSNVVEVDEEEIDTSHVYASQLEEEEE